MRFGIIPQIGMGATVSLWSDSHAYTVIAISKSGKKVTLQRDKVYRRDTNGISESQRYLFQPDPQGNIIYATLRKDGQFRVSKSKSIVTFGLRREYFDYHF